MEEITDNVESNSNTTNNDQCKKRLKKRMCTICGKYIIQVSRHMRSVHKVSSCFEARNLSQFIYLSKLIPFSISDLIMITKYKKALNSYLENESPLPSEIFSRLLSKFEKYKLDTIKLGVSQNKRQLSEVETSLKSLPLSNSMTDETIRKGHQVYKDGRRRRKMNKNV